MPSPAAKNFPLRWESTGDQWWYASPIDYAAANGLYDLVSELLHLDANLLIKLTSLRRLRRLESLWDDHHDVTTDDVAKCRSRVARRLLHECQKGPENNSLIRAGYGGWLIYTAAAAGDVAFVNELLERDPLLVFGEGEYGVSDVLYGAARSGKAEVFRVVMEFSIGRGNVDGERRKEEFRWEMMNRAVHAAARGGNVEVLKELVIEERDVLGYRDAKGASVLHSASARGHVEVVKYLLASFDISTIVDSQGNTALHVAAYRGHSAVVEVLITASPSLASLSNHYGDTFLHMAVAGFRAPGFRRMDKQIELVKQLVCGDIVNVQDIINDRNNNGRTALHIAVSENIHSSVVEHLMSVPSIDLNIRDGDGMTPLDILKQRPKSPSSELLMKQLISAGGISKCRDHKARRVIVSHLRTHGIGSSPGTSFRIPDAEIFLYTGIDNASDASGYQSCLQSGEISQLYSPKSISNKKIGSVNSTARRLKHFLQWPRRKEKKESNIDLGDADSLDSYRPSTDLEDSPIPLRQLYSNTSSLPNNKRIHSLPSPYTKMKYTARLTHGVIQTAPHFGFPAESNASPISQSAMSSPAFVDKKKGADNIGSPRSASAAHSRQSSFNAKLLHKYLCVGAQGVKAEESVSSTWDTRSFKHSTSLVT